MDQKNMLVKVLMHLKTLKEVLQILNRNELLLNMTDNDAKVSVVEMD